MNCDGCGMCCCMPGMPWLDKEHSTWCKHYIQGEGCEIWENRPWQCASFNCWYHLATNLPKDMKPDICGCYIEKFDDIFIIVVNSDNFNSWYNIKEFIKQVRDKGYSCVITSYVDVRKLVFAAPGQKTTEIMKRVQEMAREEYGSTKLHN